MQRIKLVCSLVMLVAIAALVAPGQFGPFSTGEGVPQAKTGEELDAYLDIVVEKTPEQRLLKVKGFLSSHQGSQMTGAVHVYEMLSYEELNDVQGVLRAGRDVLAFLPDNLRALVSLAAAIPNVVRGTAEDQALLKQAEGYARRGIAVLQEKRIPSGFPLEEWETERDRIAAEAHEALGHIAVKQGDLDLAVAELQQAVEQNPIPEGRQFFRLGMVYSLQGNFDSARSCLLRAAELGPDLIRERSREELVKLPLSPAKAGDR